MLVMTAVAPPAFIWLLQFIGLYFAIGLIVATGLLCLGNRGLGAFDPHALRDADGKATIGFRMLIFPGLVALWPLLLWRRVKAGDAAFARRRDTDRSAHIDRRHRASFILLLFFLPPLFALALFSGRSAGPPAHSLDSGTHGLSTAPANAGVVPVARATVAEDLENAFVPRLQLELLVVREAATPGGALWLHTRSALDLLPPDTLLYWTPATAARTPADDRPKDSENEFEANEIAGAYLLGALPAGSGRLALPDGATAGALLGYSLAHQKVLFRTRLRAVTE